MKTTPATRRLAAILAADVAGYSRLMAADEDGTLARFKLLRFDHFEPAVRARGGRVVGEAGDSLLVEFPSATEAVTCAVEVQEKLAALNAELPEDRRMRFRMGTNLGEVVVDGETIHGDGVNVAARLEKLAEPGGLVVAQSVHQQIRGKLPQLFDDLGEKSLHNIAEPVRVLRLRSEGSAEPQVALRSDERATVAILPFANMSGDPDQEYFADGITEDLITALAKFRALSVAARNSTFVYKGRAVKVQDVGRELGTDYVIEGSVRRAANRVRVTAQLIDTGTGAHIWAERFDRELTDLFEVQDEIVTALVAQLTTNIFETAAGRRREMAPARATAYDHVLRARSAWRRGAHEETLAHYRKSVDADTYYAPGLAGVGFLFAYDRITQVTDTLIAEMTRLAHEFTRRAIAENDDDAFVHHLVGTSLLCLGDQPKARYHLERAYALNPNFPSTAINLGCTLAHMGAHREGLAMVQRAFWLDARLPPAMREGMIEVHYLNRDYESTVADFERLETLAPHQLCLLAGSLAQAGRNEQARAVVKDFEALRPPWFDIAGFAHCYSHMSQFPEDQEHWLEGFRKAGLIP